MPIDIKGILNLKSIIHSSVTNLRKVCSKVFFKPQNLYNSPIHSSVPFVKRKVHWVAYVYAAVILRWKPGKSSKFRPILAIQETLTDFYGDQANFFLKYIVKPHWWWLYSTNRRTNPWNFPKKILRIGGVEKLCFFESAILIFLLHPPMKICQSFLDIKHGLKSRWFPWFSAQNNSCVNICNTLYRNM